MVATPVPRPATIAFEELQVVLQRNVGTWWECFSVTGQARIKKIIADISRDEQEATKGTRAHRLRRDPRQSDRHVEVLMEDHAPWVQLILGRGASIIWDYDGTPRIADPQASQSDQWGFNVARLKWRGEKLGWPDKEIIYFLEYG